MRSIALLSLIVLVTFATAPAVAQSTYVFIVSDGYWGNRYHWSPSEIPGPGDSVYIGSGQTCSVIEDQACASFTVLGTLQIYPGQSLTITGDSSLTGSLEIRGDESDTAELIIADDLQISGGGEIEMWSGVIVGAAETDELTLKWAGTPQDVMRVHGDGEIKVALTNGVYVVGDHAGGSLRLTEEPKQATYEEFGDHRGSWMAALGGQLSVEVGVTGTGRWDVGAGTIAIDHCCSVEGDVSVAPGTFLVDSDVQFCTTGKLEWAYAETLDGTIEVKAGGSATFGGVCSACQ